MIDPVRIFYFIIGLSMFIVAFVVAMKAPSFVQLILVLSAMTAVIVSVATWLLFYSVSVALERRIQNYMIWVAIIAGVTSAFLGAYLMTEFMLVETK